ncbi:MAG: hypothetical protein AMJ59_02160 [Gammaproteobacteria bacterium SG8_31]|jgi:3',5'-cyclic AMP phosphodiesterase CpdA|nr:MAG: hypothetical protein AMJ59_02160 [Gammaproteobacteria bacterium SG8_31]
MANDQNTAGVDSDTLTFAHLTDAHLTSPEGADARELCNKRLLSYIAWRRHRRLVHDPAILARLISDLKTLGPEHVAITGDLTNLGLIDECRAALDWLAALDAPEHISLIPGNHDRLVSAPWPETMGLWRAFMESDDGHTTGTINFPTIRIRGPVAFIGLSSAIPTPPLLATGELGSEQRSRLGQLLARTRDRGLFRVILIHHPPVPGAYKWRKRLIDSEATAAVIRDCGAELVLHGHTHRIVRNELTSRAGRSIPVVGLASASSAEASPQRAARFSLWSVTRRTDGTFSVTHRSRRHDPESGQFRECTDWNPIDAV